MKLQLWLLQETDKARKFQRCAPGTQVHSALQEIWIPRSVCSRILKFPVELGVWQRRCEVEVADWFVEKHDLGTNVIA